jgi:peroxiredoxin
VWIRLKCHATCTGRRDIRSRFFPIQKAEVIRRYDLLHPGAGVKGQDIARPAEFLVDSSGVIRWANLTEDYRVRARRDQIIEQAKGLE